MMRTIRSLSTLRTVLAGTLLLLCVAAGPVSAASLTAQELQILGKSLAFLQTPLRGNGLVAIVYSAADAGSLGDAQAISDSLSQGLAAAGTVLRPELVEAGALAQAEFDLVIVAAGANDDSVMRVVRERHALCVTGDIASVKAGTCVMAIRSGQRVEILFNYQAAKDAGIAFANAFRMMVQEL